jgi:hypothetical protein
MSLFWLAPVAFAGLALLAAPLLVHLLAQPRSERLLFPSLRFLPSSQLAALRRRTIDDRPLLLVRLFVIAAAVAAAAGPVLVSDTRRAAWDTRIARAVVITDEDPAVIKVADEEARNTFASARFAEPRIVDAIRSAATWLSQQPPSARELVVVGDLREGMLAATDLEMLAPHVGVRFLPVSGAPPGAVVIGSVADAGGNGDFEVSRVRVDADTVRTAAVYESALQPGVPRIEVVAAPEHQALADAVLRAALRDGVTYEIDAKRSVVFRFAGANQLAKPPTPPRVAWMQQVLQRHADLRGGEVDGALVIHAPLEPGHARAPALLSHVIKGAFAPDLRSYEPRMIAPATLTSWSRPPSGAPGDALPADEGDRRWLWGAALVLLAVEQVMRQRRRRV